MRALVNPDPFCVPLASIPLDTDVTSLILPDLTSLHLVAIHSLRQHCFDKSIPSSALYNKTPRLPPSAIRDESCLKRASASAGAHQSYHSLAGIGTPPRRCQEARRLFFLFHRRGQTRQSAGRLHAMNTTRT
jgi:hypothetical protein